MGNELLNTSILKSIWLVVAIVSQSILGIAIGLIFYIVFSGLEMIFIQKATRTGTIILPFWVAILPMKKREKIIEYIK